MAAKSNQKLLNGVAILLGNSIRRNATIPGEGIVHPREVEEKAARKDTK